MLRVEALSQEEKNELANIWRKHGNLLRKLENGVMYTSIVELVESKRDKEIIEKTVPYINDALQGFYREREEEQGL